MRISDWSSDVCSSDLAESLKQVQVVTADGNRVPLSAFTRFEVGNAPLRVSHEGLFAAESISFSLAPGVSLEQATQSIENAVARTGLPTQQLQEIGRASCRERVCQYV